MAKLTQKMIDALNQEGLDRFRLAKQVGLSDYQIGTLASGKESVLLHDEKVRELGRALGLAQSEIFTDATEIEQERYSEYLKSIETGDSLGALKAMH